MKVYSIRCLCDKHSEMVTREMEPVHALLSEKINEFHDEVGSMKWEVEHVQAFGAASFAFGEKTLREVKADIKRKEIQLNWMIKLNNEYRVVLQERAKAFGPQLKGSFYDL